MIDVEPATTRMTAVLAQLRDEDLGRPTPCPGSTVGDLVDHVGTFARAFAGKAGGTSGPSGSTGPPPPPDAANLGPDWRDELPRDLEALAAAWRPASAWEGMTVAGGLEMPAAVAGLVALDELLVHGWDLAVAIGQPYAVSDAECEAAIGFVSSFEAPRDGQLFGPIVVQPDDAPLLEQLLGLTGRDPAWAPGP